MKPKTYQDYLLLFQEEEDKGKNAYGIQQGFLALSRGAGDWDSLDMKDLPCGDYFTHICESSLSAMKEIWKNPQEKVLRVHEKMPVHQLREMDSYCVNWLSRKEGRTKREKLSLNPKLMGVKRLRSLDTGENRLFLAYMKKILGQLTVHLSAVPEPWQREEFFQIQRQIRRQVKSETWAEVGQWQHLPPNNSLLSHKDYGVIWKAWRKLRHLDEEIALLFQGYDRYLLTLMEAHLLVLLKNICHCPQGALSFSKEEGQFQGNFYGVDGGNKGFSLSRQGERLELSTFPMGEGEATEKQTHTLEIKEGILSLSTGKEEKSFPFLLSQVEQYTIAFLYPLGFTARPPVSPSLPQEKQRERMVDFFPLFPVYLNEEGQAVPLDQPLLWQEEKLEPQDKSDKKKSFYSCHESRSLSLHAQDFYSILSTMPLEVTAEGQQALEEKNRKLVQEGKKVLPCDVLTLLSPDGLDDFLLRGFQKNLRSVYSHMETLPKSLGLAFHHQYQESFSPQQGIVVLDLLGQRLSMTPLKPTIEELFLHKIGKTHPFLQQFQGLVWERHPTTTHILRGEDWLSPFPSSWKGYGDSFLEVCTLEGLSRWEEGFPFFVEHQKAVFWDSSLISGVKVDITAYLDGFLQEQRGFSGEGENLQFLTSCPFLEDGKGRLLSYSPERQYEGCFAFDKMQKYWMSQSKDLMLWRDMLPQLEIHLGIYEIPLVRANEKIRPQQGIAVDIPIGQEMKLEQGKETYRFKVKKEDSLQRYQAVVHRSSFGVAPEEEIHCQLEMTYEYGAQEPYCLYLKPLGQGRKTKVEWVLQQEEDWQDLAYPPFPQAMDLDNILYGKVSHRIDLLQSTWVANLEPWEVVTGEALAQDNYTLDTPQGEIYFPQREVEHLIYLLENPRYPHQKPVKQGEKIPFCYTSSYGTAKQLTPLDRRLADQRFALYRLFTNGRTVVDLPNSLGRAVIENMEGLMDCLPCAKGKVGEFHFLALCLLYEHLDERFYDYCHTVIHHYHQEKGKFMPDCLGYPLGDLSTEPQRSLLDGVFTLPEKKQIPILAKAMWNHEDFILACPSVPLLELLDTAVTRLGTLYRKMKKNPHQSGKIALCLEFMLGLFRLRSTGEEWICRKLSLNEPKIQELKSLISTMGEDPLCGKIYSNIQLKRRGGISHRENFFHLFLLYLVGDLGGADIQIIQNVK